MTKEIIYQRVLTSLTAIEARVSTDLLYEITIEHLAFNLSDISRDVLSSNKRFVATIPASFDVDLIETVGHDGKFLTAYGKENELSRLMNRINELTETNRRENISLIIHPAEFHLPSSISIEVIKSFIPRLEVAHRKVTEKSVRNLKRIKMMIMSGFAYQRVESELKNLSIELNHQQISLLTALAFVGSGHLPTAEEYNIKPIIKESKWVINRELFEETGIKRKDTDSRYYKYHEVLARGFKNFSPMEKISVDDLVRNAIRSAA